MAQADSLIRMLLPRRSELAPYDRHGLDYLAASLASDHPGRYAAARQAAAIAPQSLFAAVHLPGAALDINRPHEALALLGRIDVGHSAARGLRGYWLLQSVALHAVEDYEAQLELGRAVRRQMPEEPRGLAYQVRALAALGRQEELERILGEGLRLPATTQWRNYGLYLHMIAFDELVAHGQAEWAAVLLDSGLRVTEEAWPANTPEAMARLLRALCLLRLNRPGEARMLLEHLRERPLDSLPPTAVPVWGHLGLAAALQGDSRAVAEIDRWLAAPPLAPHSAYPGERTLFRASIQSVLGNREEAIRLLQQAMREGASVTSELHSRWPLMLLRGDADFDEMLRPKG
jgi:tetratricopeptide (TPR) repeat protein